MLTIENHILVLDGEQHQLPKLARKSTLKVWKVPTSYRTSGVFITAQLPEELEEIPACDISQCKFVGEAELDAHPDAVLAQAKVDKKAQIAAERDAQCERPVTALGRTWDADKRSQELLAQAILVAQNGGPLPSVWRDKNNDHMPITHINDLMAIMNAIRANIQAAYATSWARKAAVDAAASIEDLYDI